MNQTCYYPTWPPRRRLQSNTIRTTASLTADISCISYQLVRRLRPSPRTTFTGQSEGTHTAHIWQTSHSFHGNLRCKARKRELGCLVFLFYFVFGREAGQETLLWSVNCGECRHRNRNRNHNRNAVSGWSYSTVSFAGGFMRRAWP